jgi:hypothetical protein
MDALKCGVGLEVFSHGGTTETTSFSQETVGKVIRAKDWCNILRESSAGCAKL